MTTWRKSSHSDETGGECVELAVLPHVIAIRDSKAPNTPHLLLAPDAFATLLTHAKQGKLDV